MADVKIRIKAVNAFQRGISSAIAGVKKLGRVTLSVSKSLAKFGKKAFLGFAIGLIAAIKHAHSFRVEMAGVSVMLGDNAHLTKEMSREIGILSATFGEAKNVLAKGLYDILSAGAPAAEAMEFLEVALRAAIGGATDTATSVDALTTVINAYGLAASDAGRVSDIMFQIVKDGKVTYAELAENIGKLAPIAKVAGLTLEELGATLGTILKVEKPERAMTAITAAMTEAAERGKTLFEIVDKFKGKDFEKIVKSGISKRAAVGVAILASNYKTLSKELIKFKNTAGASGSAFEKMDKVGFWRRGWQSFLLIVQRTGKEFDKSFGPIVDRVAKKMVDLAKSEEFETFTDNLGKSLDEWAIAAEKNIKTVLTAWNAGGKSRTAVIEGFKSAAFSFAKNAAAALALYVPAIGSLLGRAVQSSLFGLFSWFGKRAAAEGIVVQEHGGVNALNEKFSRKEIKRMFAAKTKELSQLNLEAAGAELAGRIAGGSMGGKEMLIALEKLNESVKKIGERK